MTTYYVSGAGADSNNGLSTTTAFHSLGRAVWSLKTGDTILMMNGIYSAGSMLFNFNGSPTNWTTIKNYPGHTPQLILTNDGINIFSCSYLQIQGLVLVGNRANITLDYALSQKDNLNNPLTSANGIAIKPYKNSAGVGGTTPHHIVINGNTISNFCGGGIASSDADYLTFSNNIVRGNAWYSPFGCQGITNLYAVNTDNNATDYKIIYSNNIVFNNQSLIPWSQSGKITEGHGLMLDTMQQSRDGIPYLGKSLIANNITYNNGSSGIQVFKSANVDIINNTSSQNALVLTNAGEIDVTYSTNVNASKNILYATTGQNGNILKYCTNVNYLNNLVYNSALFQASDNLVGVQPVNVLGKDPLFFNKDNADFHLTSGSPAIFSNGSKWGYEGTV